MQQEKELKACSFAKTVLMVIIVLYHSMLAWKGSWFSVINVAVVKPLALVVDYMATFHIYAFALVSGYIFYYAKCECGKYSDYLSFVKNKFYRLIIPYITVSLLWAIPFGVLFFKYNFWDVIYNYAFAVSPNQLWFLLMLFGVFLLFWPITSFVKKHFWCGFFIVGAFYAIGVLGNAFLPNIFQIWTACKYVIFFWLGFIIRQYGLTKYVNTWPVWVILHIALLALSNTLHNYKSGYLMTAINMGVEIAVFIAGAIMAFLVLQFIGTRINVESYVLTSLGKRSMPIYLLHQQIVYVSLYLLNDLVNPYIHSIINFVVSLVLSFVISTLLMKFKVTSFLIGEKFVNKKEV